MADRRDERGAARGGRSDEGLVRERQEVLDGAATAGDDDHLDVLAGVELGDRGGHLRDGRGALHRDLADLEAHLRPACARVDHDVVLRLRLAAAHEPDDARQERQRSLALGSEQALRSEDRLEVLDPREEVAEPERADLLGLHLERAAALPERRLRVDDDVRALRERRRLPGEHLGVERDGQRHVRVGVTQRQEGHACARAAVELDDLPLDPDGRHLVDVLRDLRRQEPHRPGPLCRRVEGARRQGTVRGRGRGEGSVGHAPIIGHGGDTGSPRPGPVRGEGGHLDLRGDRDPRAPDLRSPRRGAPPP